jgi:hypothetical protein
MPRQFIDAHMQQTRDLRQAFTMYVPDIVFLFGNRVGRNPPLLQDALPQLHPHQRH